MPQSWLIRGARQLLTLRGPAPRRGGQLAELGIIQDGAVLVVGDRIREVASSRRLDNVKEARGAEVYEAAGKVVMPGFVDSHTHFIYPGLRHSDLEQPGAGVGPTIQSVRDMSPRILENRARRWLHYSAACGVTTIEGKSGLGLTLAAERKMLRVVQKTDGAPVSVAPTFFGAHVPPPEFHLFPDEYVDLIIQQMLPAVVRGRLAEFCEVLCDEPGFTVSQGRRVLAAAQSLGLRLKVQAGRFARMGGVRLAVETGAVSVAHLNRLDEDEVDLLAASPTIATLLPAASGQTPSGSAPPARRLLERGAAVALASGFGPASSRTLNMQTVLALACTELGLTPAEAISAATINGAAALNRAATAGSLEPGKFADLLVLDVGDYREIAYYFGMNLCLRTMRHGQWLTPRPPENVPA